MGILSWLFGTSKKYEKEYSKKSEVIEPEQKKHIIIFIDIETTGLSLKNDEILQLSMIDEDENVLFNEYFKPLNKTSWEKAEEINHITPKMVSDKPTFRDRLPVIQSYLDKYSVIAGYNIAFDVHFMIEHGAQRLQQKSYIDIMREYEKFTGKRAKLIIAAKQFGYDFMAHEALEDIKATLYIYKALKRKDYLSMHYFDLDELPKPRLSHEEYMQQKIGDKTIAEIQAENYEEVVKRNFKEGTPTFKGLHIFSSVYPPQDGYDTLSDGEKEVFSALVDCFQKNNIAFDKVRMVRSSTGDFSIDHPSCIAGRIQVKTKPTKYDIYPIGKKTRKRVAKNLDEAHNIISKLGNTYEIRERKDEISCSVSVNTNKIKYYGSLTLAECLSHVPEIISHIKDCLRDSND